MNERFKSLLRWGLVGLAVVLLVRSSSGGGCSTLVAEGTPAPSFSVPDAGGRGTWSLEVFEGKPVALVFFATWCPSCRAELPEIARAVGERPGTNVLLLSDEDPGHVGTWLKARGFEIPAAGRASAAWHEYGVRVVPSVVVVGADGKVAFAGQGGTSLSQALELLRPKGDVARGDAAVPRDR